MSFEPPPIPMSRHLLSVRVNSTLPVVSMNSATSCLPVMVTYRKPIELDCQRLAFLPLRSVPLDPAPETASSVPLQVSTSHCRL